MVRVLNIYVEVEEAEADGVWGYQAKIKLGAVTIWEGDIHYDRRLAYGEAEDRLADRLSSLLS